MSNKIEFSGYLSKIKNTFYFSILVLTVGILFFARQNDSFYFKWFFSDQFLYFRYSLILIIFIFLIFYLKFVVMAYLEKPLISVSNGFVVVSIIGSRKIEIEKIDHVFRIKQTYYIRVGKKNYGIPLMFCRDTRKLSENMDILAGIVSNNAF